jgi:hypothetical protein
MTVYVGRVVGDTQAVYELECGRFDHKNRRQRAIRCDIEQTQQPANDRRYTVFWERSVVNAILQRKK